MMKEIKSNFDADFKTAHVNKSKIWLHLAKNILFTNSLSSDPERYKYILSKNFIFLLNICLPNCIH